MYNSDPNNVFLAIATNIPVLLMTAFVLQAHIYALFSFTSRVSSLAASMRILFRKSATSLNDS